MPKVNQDDDLAWGYRFSELINALIDCGVRMQKASYIPGAPNIIKFFLRPGGIRFILSYDPDLDSEPGKIVLKKILFVFPIDKVVLQDDLNRNVSETAADIFAWASGTQR